MNKLLIGLSIFVGLFIILFVCNILLVKYSMAKRHRNIEDIKIKVAEYNKTGNMAVLDHLFLEFYNEDIFVSTAAVSVLAEITKENQNEKIEEALVSLYFKPFAVNKSPEDQFNVKVLKTQIVQTLSTFDLKTDGAIKLMIQSFKNWQITDAFYAAEYFVSQKKIFKAEVISEFKNNRQHKDWYLYDTIIDTFSKDSRYKVYLDELGMLSDNTPKEQQEANNNERASKRIYTFEELKIEIEKFNKTDDYTILDQIFSNFENNELKIIMSLADIIKERQNVKIENKLIEFNNDPAINIKVKDEIILVLSIFYLKSEKAKELMITNFSGEWNSWRAVYASNYIIKQEKLYKDEVIEAFKRNLPNKDKNKTYFNAIFKFLSKDDRYKELLKEHAPESTEKKDSPNPK